MTRRRLSFAGVTLLIISGILAVQTIRSCWFADCVDCECWSRDVWIGMSFGRLYVTVARVVPGTLNGGWAFPHTPLSPSLPTLWFDNFGDWNTFTLPLWMPAALTLAGGFLVLWKRQQPRAGHCL